MLPLEWVNIVPVDKLQPGDFAFLLENGHERVVVGTIDGHVSLAYLDDPSVSYIHVNTFDGDALVIRDWSVEVDEESAGRFDRFDQRKHGTISISAGKVSLACPPQQGPGYVLLPICQTEIPNPPSRYAFAAWRLVKMNGKEKVALFERPTATA